MKFPRLTTKFLITIFTAILTLSNALIPAPTAFAATPWPASSGTVIASAGSNGLPGGFEPSGLIQMSAGLVIADDSGDIAVLDENGDVLNFFEPFSSWTDIEALTTIDPTSNIIYLGIEQPIPLVLEFDISTGTLTGQEWDLSDCSGCMPSGGNQGLEAIVYANGHFYVGLQANANVYKFDLLPDGQVNLAETFSTYYPSDMAGLYYDETTGWLYAVYDSRNRLVITDLNNGNAIVDRFNLPGNAQEGITLGLYPSTDMYIAQDSGSIVKYENFPTQQPPYVDLYVNNLHINPVSQRLWYSIGNTGNMTFAVPRFGIDRLYIDDIPFKVRSWSAGETQVSKYSIAGSYVRENWIIPRTLLMQKKWSDGETHKVKVCIDDSYLVEELFEDNNCAELEWEYDANPPYNYAEAMPVSKEVQEKLIDNLNDERDKKRRR